MREMLVGAVDMVGAERAAGAALLPVRREHEVLHDELAAPVEEIRKRAFSRRRVENVFLLDLHPWQLTAFGHDLVAQFGQFLFAREMPFAGGNPVVA